MTFPSEYSRQALRERAEDLVPARAALTLAALDQMSQADMRNTVHELQVHQIELEMQNEELRQTQFELDAARARYFDLYDMAPVGYCSVSENGFIVEANFTVATLLDRVRSDLVNKPVSRFIVKADQDVYYCCRKALFDTSAPQDCDLRVLKRDGTPLWVHMRITATGVSAATLGAGAPVERLVLSDISERKRLELALQQRNLDLEAARAAADRASQAKSDFLSNMTHELRSPLNSILGFAQLLDLSATPPTAEQKSSIDQILRAGWYLLDLIGEILDLTAIESGQLKLALEPVPLVRVLDECQRTVEEQARKRNIQMHFMPGDETTLVLVDSARMQQIMGHLLRNAIQYNRANGSLEVTCIPAAGNRVRIRVRDTGEGLTPQKLSGLFQPFNRLGRETSAAVGTGVGLALSKRLVELMGGAIGAESTPGVGSVFWVEVNLAQASTTSLARPFQGASQ